MGAENLKFFPWDALLATNNPAASNLYLAGWRWDGLVFPG
jgi:hypothetical protein